MNKSKTIAAIIKRHGAAFIGLTSEQRDALHNAMCAAYTAGNQARPDYNLDALLGGDTSEKLTPQEATLKRIYDNAPPIPDDTTGQCEWMDKIDAAKREQAHYLDRVDTLKREGAVVREAVMA